MKHKKEFYIIYLTKNLVTNKCYIGQHATNNLNDGYIGSGKLVNYSIKKYGAANHVSGIIEFCTEDNISEREKFWIKEKNTMVPIGYNLTRGGGGGNTFILLSEEDKQKFRENSSKNNKGKVLSKETKEKISESHKGHSWNKGSIKSKECKQKMSEAWEIRRLTPVSEETRVKHRQNRLGKTHSKETKEKIGNANAERVWKEESKAKISKANKGLKRSEETLQKMRKKHRCVYCGKEMNKSNLTRYHNDNCKVR